MAAMLLVNTHTHTHTQSHTHTHTHTQWDPQTRTKQEKWLNNTTLPPLYKLRKSPKLIRSLRLLQLGQGRRCTGSKREDCMASWCKKREYNAQISPKSELCGFKWANTHNRCVHDSM